MLTCCHSQMQIYCYEENEFESIDDALRGNGRITALSILFEVSLLSCTSQYNSTFFFFLSWYSETYMVSQESADDNENYAALIDGVSAVSRYGMWCFVCFYFILVNTLQLKSDLFA